MFSVFPAMEFLPEAVSKSCHATKHKLPGHWNCYVPGIARVMDFRNSHWNQGGVSTNWQVNQFRAWKNHAGKLVERAPNQGRIGKLISCWDHQYVDANIGQTHMAVRLQKSRSQRWENPSRFVDWRETDLKGNCRNTFCLIRVGVGSAI